MTLDRFGAQVARFRGVAGKRSFPEFVVPLPALCPWAVRRGGEAEKGSASEAAVPERTRRPAGTFSASRGPRDETEKETEMETEMERTGGDGRRHVADAVNDYAAQVSE